MSPYFSDSRIFADYRERVRSLLSDGYRLRHETCVNGGVICRLHHMSNGNDIILSAIGSHLVQKTNHVVTHEQQY